MQVYLLVFFIRKDIRGILNLSWSKFYYFTFYINTIRGISTLSFMQFILLWLGVMLNLSFWKLSDILIQNEACTLTFKLFSFGGKNHIFYKELNGVITFNSFWKLFHIFYMVMSKLVLNGTAYVEG